VFLMPMEERKATRFMPWAVCALIALNLLFFIPVYDAGAMEATSFFARYGFIPATPHAINLLTSMFVHADFLQVCGNMFFLLMFGDTIEDVIGPACFLLVFAIGGLGAIGCHYLFNPDSTTPCLGTSGAISAILGMYATFFQE